MSDNGIGKFAAPQWLWEHPDIKSREIGLDIPLKPVRDTLCLKFAV